MELQLHQLLIKFDARDYDVPAVVKSNKNVAISFALISPDPTFGFQHSVDNFQSNFPQICRSGRDFLMHRLDFAVRRPSPAALVDHKRTRISKCAGGPAQQHNYYYIFHSQSSENLKFTVAGKPDSVWGHRQTLNIILAQ